MKVSANIIWIALARQVFLRVKNGKNKELTSIIISFHLFSKNFKLYLFLFIYYEVVYSLLEVISLCTHLIRNPVFIEF